jgi:urea carboxylase
MPIHIEAPLSGTILRIETELGARVNGSEVLLILESMKMEMPVVTPVAGRVVEIRVEKGQSVTEGDVLIVLE